MFCILLVACHADPDLHSEPATALPPAPTTCTAPTMYADADGDGFGDPDDSWDPCVTDRAGGTTNAEDCDDGDAGVSPAAPTDGCDGIDDDCDDQVDEDAASVSWFADADGDGFGAEEIAVGCAAPATASSSQSGDCDDSRADVHPGAVDVCGSGVDEDCDGVPPCGTWGMAPLDGIVLTGDAVGDRWGDRGIPVGDLDADGHVDLLVEAPWLGRVDLVRGDLSATAASAWASFSGFTVPTTAAADADGDGLPEVWIGELLPGTGVVSMFRGPFSGAVPSASAVATWSATPELDPFAIGLVDVGDTSGDGREEVAVTGVEDAPGFPDVVLLLGDATGAFTEADALATLTRPTDAVMCCSGNPRQLAAPGDADGDGLADLLIGDRSEAAPRYEFPAGRTDLVLAPFGGVASVDDVAAATWNGENVGDRAGYGLAAGDLDGDGTPEVAIGADLWNDWTGVVYLVSSADRGSVSLATAATRLEGVAPDDFTGRRIAIPGDMDGDGWADLAVNAGGASTLYLVYGPVAGVVDLGSLPDDRTGTDEWSPLAGGDVDGDGFADVVVGYQFDDQAGTDAGAIHVLLGGSF